VPNYSSQYSANKKTGSVGEDSQVSTFQESLPPDEYSPIDSKISSYSGMSVYEEFPRKKV
jgi:hypothetical protein